MSDIIFYDRQTKNRLPLQALSDDSLCYDNIVENINFETIKEIECQLKYLNDLAENDENIIKISKVMSHFFSVLKRDYYDIYMKLRNELTKNKNSNLIKFKEKSNSLLSIVDIKMEIKDYDSLDKLVSNIDLNKNFSEKLENRFHRTPAVKIFKECAVNTEIEIVDETTQTDPCKTDKNSFDSTQKILYFRGQTKEIKDLIDELQMKNEILEEKCRKSLDLLSLVNERYRIDFLRINCEKIDFTVNTCESWMSNYEKLLLDSEKLLDADCELEKSNNRIGDLESELSIYKVDNSNQSRQIDELNDRIDKLTQEKQNLQNELNDVKDTNEFLNAEHQSLSIQIEKMQEDWNATIKLNEERLRKTRMDFRKENSRLLLELQDMEFKFQGEHMHNSQDKLEVGYLEKRIEKLLLDISNYPLLGNDLEKENKDLKRRITILEDKRIRHAQEKEKLLHYKSVMIDKVDKKSEELIKKINMLQNAAANLESDNQELRTRLDSFIKLCEELRKINLNFENRNAEKYCDSFRAILSNFGA